MSCFTFLSKFQQSLLMWFLMDFYIVKLNKMIWEFNLINTNFRACICSDINVKIGDMAEEKELGIL